MSDVKLENGVLVIHGHRGAIVVPAKQVRMATATRDMTTPDASLHWVRVSYENANGLLQELTLDCGGITAASNVVDDVIRHCVQEMGKSNDSGN